MGMLDGKRILVTGVLTDASLAFAVARLAQEEGAEIVLSGAGRGLSLTRRTARKLPTEPDVLEIDVTRPEQLAAAGDGAGRPLGPARRPAPRHRLRPAVVPRAATCSPPAGTTCRWPWRSPPTPSRPWSEAFLPLLEAAGADGGASVVGLDFDATVAWPLYDWMGVAKAALESLTRYLARDLGPAGVRVNLVAAGPVRTMAAKSIPGFSAFEDTWAARAPLGWDVHDADVVAKACVALLSDWLPDDHRRDAPRRRRRPRRGSPEAVPTPRR